jgi:hypothetical protein
MVSEGTPGFRECDSFERGRTSQGMSSTNGGAGFSVRARNTPWRGRFQAMRGDALTVQAGTCGLHACPIRVSPPILSKGLATSRGKGPEPKEMQ